jgi:hypothetical protein
MINFGNIYDLTLPKPNSRYEKGLNYIIKNSIEPQLRALKNQNILLNKKINELSKIAVNLNRYSNGKEESSYSRI